MENKKYIQALAEIKLLLNDFYQKLGREEIDASFEMKDLIEEIDDIVSKIQVPSRYLVAKKLKNETEM